MAIQEINKNDYFILIFSNETQVIATESFLKKHKIDAKIISIPRKASSGCGMALRLKKIDKQNILELLKNDNISYVNSLNMEEL